MAVTINRKSWDESGLAWTKNPVFLQIQADSDWEDADVYQIEVTVGLTNISFARLYFGVILQETDSSLPDFSGQVTVDVAEIVDAYLQNYKPWLQNGGIGDLNPEATAPFFLSTPALITVNVRDIADGVLGPSLTERFYAFQGGLAFEDYSPAEQFAWVYKQRKFLSNAPDPKPTFPESKELIYYCPPFLDTWFDSLLVKGEVFYSDGTSAEFDPYGTDPTVTNDPNIWAIPAGYEALGLADLEVSGKDIVEYTLWVYSTTSEQIVSEYYRFALSAPSRDVAQIIFRNSFGVYETLSGSIRRRQFTSRSEFGQRSLLTNYLAKDGQQFIQTVEGQRQYRFTSAFLNNSEAELYQEIGRSDEILLLDRGKLIAIGNTQFTIEYFDREKDLFGLVIDFTQLNTIRSITRNVARRKQPLTNSTPFLNLTGLYVSESIVLTWTTAANSSVKFYVLTRSVNADMSGQQFVARLGSGVRNFTDAGLSAGVIYYYQLAEHYVNDTFQLSNISSIQAVENVNEAERPNGARLLSDGGVRLLSDGSIRLLTEA